MTRAALIALSLLCVTYCAIDDQRQRASVQVACINAGGEWQAIGWRGPRCVMPADGGDT